MTDIAAIGLEINSRGLDQGVRRLRQLEGQGGKTEGSMKNVAAAATKMAATVAGAGTAVAAYVSHVANGVRETNNLARAVGVTTSQLQAWQSAAKTVGVDTDKLGDIFKDVQDKIGDFARTGGGEAADIFEQLNLNVKEMLDLSPDQQLLKIGEALESVQSQGEKVFFLESIADDASRLIPLLENNGEELNRLVQRAYDTGQALTELDNIALINLSTSISETKQQVSGLGQVFSAEIAPALNIAFDAVQEFVEGFDQEDVRSFVNSTLEGAGYVADVLHQVDIVIREIGFAFTQMAALGTQALADTAESAALLISTALRPVQDAISSIIEIYSRYVRAVASAADSIGMESTAAALNGLASATESTASSIDTFTVSAQGLRDLNDAVTDSVHRQSDALKALRSEDPPSVAMKKALSDERKEREASIKTSKKQRQEIVANKTTVESAVETYSQWQSRLRDFVEIGPETAARMAQIRDRLQEIYEKSKQAGDATGEFSKEAIRLQKELDGLKPAARGASTEIDEFTRRTQERMDDIGGQFFRDLFDDGLDSFENFADSVEDMFKDLIAEMTYMWVKSEIFNIGEGRGVGFGGAGGGVGDFFDIVTGAGYELALGSVASAAGSGAVAGGAAQGAGMAGGAGYLGAGAGSAASVGGLAAATWFANQELVSAIDDAGVYDSLGVNNDRLLTQMGFGNNTYWGVWLSWLDSALQFVGFDLDKTLGLGSGRKPKFGFKNIAEDPSLTGANLGHDTDGGDEPWYSSGGFDDGSLGRGRTTAFGSFGFTYKEMFEPEDMVKVLDSLEQMDNAISSMLDPDQIESVKDELDGFDYNGKNLKGVVAARLAGIIESIDSEYVESVFDINSGLSGRIYEGDINDSFTRLISGLAIENVAGEMGSIVADQMFEGFQEAVNSDITNKGLKELADRFTAVGNTILTLDAASEQLGFTFDVNTEKTYDIAESINQAMGGLENLQAAQTAYYQNYFSEEERRAEIFEQLSDSLSNYFDELDVAMPQTRAAFRALVESLDATTESGSEAYVSLLQAQGQAAQYYTMLEQQQEAARKRAEEAAREAEQQFQGLVDAALRDVERAFDAERDRLESSYQKTIDFLSQRLDGLRDKASALDAFARTLRDAVDGIDVGQTIEQQLSQFQGARSEIGAALAIAQAGGPLPTDGGLDDALREVQKPAEKFYSSFEDYQREQVRTAQQIKSLEGLTSEQLTDTEKQIELLQRQEAAAERMHAERMSALDQQLAEARALAGKTDTLSGQVYSIDVALQRLYDALSQDPAASEPPPSPTTGGAGGSTGGDAATETPVEDVIRALASLAVKSFGTRDDGSLSDDGVRWLYSTAKDRGISIQEIDDVFPYTFQRIEQLGLPAFANGGIHAGGWRMVGERGPELEWTPPSRIMSNTSMNNNLNTEAVRAAVDTMRGELGGILRDIMISSRETADIIDDWDTGGVPAERDVTV